MKQPQKSKLGLCSGGWHRDSPHLKAPHFAGFRFNSALRRSIRLKGFACAECFLLGMDVNLNRSKILQQAQKYRQRRSLDRALKEYNTLLQMDPDDTSARIKVGDLHLRLNATDDAIDAYSKAADSFVKDGYEARAVALYKQILQIDESRFEFFTPLAELQEKLGLNHEAANALRKLVDLSRQAGRRGEVIETLKHIARLQPLDLTSRRELAEAYLLDSDEDAALAEYASVVKELNQAERFEDSISIYRAALELRPDSVESLTGLVKTLCKTGELDEAHRYANAAVEEDPQSIGAQEAWVHVLEMRGENDNLPDAYRKLAELHRSHGDPGRAKEILQRHLAPNLVEEGLDPALFADENEELPEASDETLYDEVPLAEDEEPALEDDSSAEIDLEPVEEVADESGAALDGFLPSGEPEQLLAEANVYLRYNKLPKAIACLNQIIEIEPNHRDAMEKLGEAHLRRDDPVQAAQLWKRASEVARTLGDLEHAAMLERRISEAGLSDEELERLGIEQAVVPVENAELDVEFSLEPEAELSAQAMNEGFDGNPLAELDGDELELGIEIDVAEEQDELGEATSVLENEEVESFASPDSATIQVDVDDAATPAEEIPLADETPINLNEEIETGRFYLDQGMYGEAAACFSRALTVEPNSEELRALLESAQNEVTSPAGVQPGGSDPAVAESQDVSTQRSESYVLDEPPSSIEIETQFPEEPLANPLEMDVEEQVAALDPTTDAGGFSGSVEESTDVNVEAADSVEPLVVASELEAAPAEILGDGEQATVLSSVPDAQSQVSDHAQTVLEQSDAQSYHDLGIGYREMGLLEHAQEAFRKSLQAGIRCVDSLLMLGLCALEEKRATDAVSHFEQALSYPEVTDDARLALEYHLAEAFEATGDVTQALSRYQRVAEIDPDFADVAARIRELNTRSDAKAPQASEEAFESFDDLLADAREILGEDAADDSSKPADTGRPKITYG